MSKKENKRAMVLRGVDRGEVPVAEAGEVMGLSQRHVRRLLAKYRRDGPQGLAHGNRGRKPCHALDAALRARILELAQTKYVRFNQQHFTEKLQEVEAIEVSRSSVRRLLVGSGIKSPRKRRAPKHRSRRERKAQEGMMLQIDGSRHDWLEGRGSWLTLVGGIDDATGIVPHALFREQEDAQGYFLLVEQIATRYGLPMSVYADGHGIFVRNHKDRLTVEEELQGEPEPTQFGRLLRELDIELIQALSPQAKGRIERLWGTFQDRLVSELRLAGARSLEEANRVLWQFLPEHNRKFAVKPAQATLAYRPLPAGMKWEKVLCFKYGRVVANDNTVKLGRVLIQIPPGAGGRSYAKARVMVHEGMDGSLSVYYQGKRIAYQQAPEQTPVLRVQKRGLPDVGSMENAPLSAHEDKNPIPAKHMAISVPRRPAPNHPWRRPVLVT